MASALQIGGQIMKPANAAAVIGLRKQSLGAVLSVDDDPVVQLMLDDIVRSAGADHHVAGSAREAEQVLEQQKFDLVLLDRKLPDSDGLLLLQTIKQSSNCPVIVLSTLDETRDKILGLGLGAADYVTKPFNAMALGDRIRTLLVRRNEERHRSQAAPIRVGKLLFQPETRSMRIEDKELYLPPAESRLLHKLLLGIGKPQSRDDLARSTSGRDWSPGDRTVDVLVARLRRRIPPDVAEIVTIYRFGYVLTSSK